MMQPTTKSSEMIGSLCWTPRVERTGGPATCASAVTASSATLVQFPVKVAHAITAHKIQGQTIPRPLKIAVDISSCWEDAQAYVMVSRVEDLEQLYILGSLPEKNVRASQSALSELLDMNKRSINENPIGPARFPILGLALAIHG